MRFSQLASSCNRFGVNTDVAWHNLVVGIELVLKKLMFKSTLTISAISTAIRAAHDQSTFLSREFSCKADNLTLKT